MSTPPWTIRVPKSDWNGRASDMRSRLVTWRWDWKRAQQANNLTLDFSGVDFMEPWGLALFAAFGCLTKHQGGQVELQLDPSNPSNAYFESMGLRELLLSGQSRSTGRQWSNSDQNTGLHRIQTEKDLAEFRRSAGQLALGHCPEASDALKYALTELGRNVLQHSGSPIGGIAIAQHFPERRGLQIAMVDAGRGLLEALRPRHPELRGHLEAARLAILPHASGAMPEGPYGDSTRNAGLGLFASSEISWRAGGSLWLASGDALLGVRGDLQALPEEADDSPSKVYRRIEPWQGTVAVMDFPVDGIPDFAGITAVWNQLADQARRLSGPAGVDFLAPNAELPESTRRIPVLPFDEDVEEAERMRINTIRPAVEAGSGLVLDFSGIRAPTQSFIHALLYDAFKVPGSLMRLSFAHCTPTTREVIKAVATYASYRQIV